MKKNVIIASVILTILPTLVFAEEQMTFIYVPSEILTAAPTTEKDIESHGCTFITKSSEEIARVRSIFSRAEVVTDERPRPWYRMAIYVSDGIGKAEKYYLQVNSKYIYKISTVGGKTTEVTGNLSFRERNDLFATTASAVYEKDPKNSKKTECAEFRPSF